MHGAMQAWSAAVAGLDMMLGILIKSNFLEKLTGHFKGIILKHLADCPIPYQDISL